MKEVRIGAKRGKVSPSHPLFISQMAKVLSRAVDSVPPNIYYDEEKTFLAADLCCNVCSRSGTASECFRYEDHVGLPF